ncbi:hypothetical protein GCM10009715_21410 [Paeniglutamicibacter psychrophenolicus]|uniref:Uncharacterized protein n=1 Tax=Paeniglutamicibacter psychrophenolicus TaxID=257454 RepID=A0ABS4WHA3_9MICC|nr:hypothetical protein [Paeniglutamicibacter psychrophenolicus]MBP2375577.1 hypothetical protein [Paeniglutamicibacter psychrophenolicus]
MASADVAVPGAASDREPRTAMESSSSINLRPRNKQRTHLSKRGFFRALGVALKAPKVWAFILICLVPGIAAVSYFAFPAVNKYVDSGLGGLWIIASSKIPAHFFTAGATLIIAFVAWRALKQKQAADRKADWWSRTQYALDQLVSGNEQSILMGANLVEFLARNHVDNPNLVDDSARRLFDEVVKKLTNLLRNEVTIEESSREDKP